MQFIDSMMIDSGLYSQRLANLEGSYFFFISPHCPNNFSFL